MKYLAIVVFALLNFSVVHAQTNNGFPEGLRGFAMSSSFQYDGVEYSYELNTNAVKDSPSWDVSDGEPPVSVSRAVEIGKAQLKKLIQKTKGWDVDWVNLHQADRKKWYYEIRFSCLELVCSAKTTDSFTVIVKMDGVPLEPKTRKAPKP